MKFHSTKGIALLMALVLLVGCVAGGTIAWLVDKTESVKNTFTYGDINITLDETDTKLDDDGDPNTNDYKMIPGLNIIKDPKVTVLAGSEKCYLFVKLDASKDFGTFMEYTIADGWTELEAGVYYRVVDALEAEEPVAFYVLANNTVSVKETVTKEMLNALTEYPTLTVTAYAVQFAGMDTVQEAWTVANA